MRAVRPAHAGAADPDAAACACSRKRPASRRDRYNLSKVRIESPIDGIVTRRNIEEGEMVVIGTMNNAGTVLLTIADMSVIEAEVEVDETDIPSVKLGQIAKITIDAIPGQDVHRQGHRDRQQPDPDDRRDAAAQATNFKVVVTLDTEIPEVRPGFTCTAEITTATRERRARGSDPGDDGARDGRRRQGRRSCRAPRDRQASARGRGRRAQAAGAQARPDAARSSRACSSSSDGKAVFTPVKTGIAGEKYFEVARRA